MIVYKYPLQQRTKLNLPKGSYPLYVGMQQNEPFIWIALGGDPELGNEEEHVFKAFPTGHSGRDFLLKEDFVGTFQTSGGFVWHVFEVK